MSYYEKNKFTHLRNNGVTMHKNKNTDNQCTIQNVSLRDFYASQAMSAVMGETQEMRIATFWDWIKFLMQQYLCFTFLTVKFVQVDNVYEDAAKRCYEYADAMIIERNAN